MKQELKLIRVEELLRPEEMKQIKESAQHDPDEYEIMHLKRGFNYCLL
jgi:hypothetical protein